MNKLVHPGPAAAQVQHQPSKPLVALLDGRDCTVEMPLLKDIATVAFCDAQLTTEIHEKVLNEAVAALLYSIRLSREDLLKFRSLKVIVKIGNPDVHNIDLVAATELGIAVCNMPAEVVEEAADHTISLILNMFRRTFWVARTVQMGKKLQNMDQLRELMASSKRVRGSTLGIIGFGRIGCAVALRAKALGFRVCFFDPHIVNGLERVIGVERAEKLAELLAQSDCITLHCPLNQETRHLLNNDSLKRLKSGAFLVNIGEADLIDLKALINSLKSGQIKAASFDISQRAMPNEQFADFESLLNMPNVICTPNCAWFSEESLKEMRISAAKEVRRALGGPIPENLQNCVNKSELFALRMAQQRGTSAGQIGGIHQNGFTANEFGIQQQGIIPSGIGMSLPRNSAIINQQHLGNEISTSSFATTVGNSTAEYSTIQAPPQPPISIEGISSAQADSLHNASALLAYQNFMMQNPQLLMAATRLAGGPIPPMPSNLPTSMAAGAQNIPAVTAAHHPSLMNNEFVPATNSQLATTGANLHSTSKSPSLSRPNSGSNVPITFKQQQHKPAEPKQRLPVEVDQATVDNIGQREMDIDNGRRIDNYPSTEQQSSAATRVAPPGTGMRSGRNFRGSNFRGTFRGYPGVIFFGDGDSGIKRGSFRGSPGPRGRKRGLREFF